MIKPLGQNVVVKPILKENKTESGIILPNDPNEKIDRGIVVAIGDLVDPMRITLLDEVFFNKFVGVEYKDGTEKYLILDFDKLYAII